MNWYNYAAWFFAGALLAKLAPHFFHGIPGGSFPTPFAKPPGTGLGVERQLVRYVDRVACGHHFHQHRTQLSVPTEKRMSNEGT